MIQSGSDWRERGRWVSTSAGSLFVRSAPGQGPTVVLLHGFPSCSYDFRQAVPHSGRTRVAGDGLPGVRTRRDNTVSAIDLAGGTVTATWFLGQQPPLGPTTLALDPATHTPYAADEPAGLVSVIHPKH